MLTPLRQWGMTPAAVHALTFHSERLSSCASCGTSRMGLSPGGVSAGDSPLVTVPRVPLPLGAMTYASLLLAARPWYAGGATLPAAPTPHPKAARTRGGLSCFLRCNVDREDLRRYRLLWNFP